MDGSKCIRVITQQQNISTDKKDIEKKADFKILSQNCIMTSAKMA